MSVKKIQRRKQAHVSSKIKHVPKVKNVEKNATKLEVESKKTSTKQKKALVIAHEIKFAKLLAGNDKKVRDKVLKNLKKWLAIRSQSSFVFVEHDFMRLWKGLYYCMWMSDKPLVQEELAESLSKLVHCFKNKDAALLYTKCTLSTLASEWFGLDHHRLDKFQMLVRRIIRQTFQMCKIQSWNREWVDGVEKIIETVLSDSRTSIGFSLHVTELYMEELAKVSDGKIPEDIVIELVRPFAIQLAGMNDERQIRHVMKHVFRYLLFQSDTGLDYVEKFEAWRHAGFPKGNIESMQKVEIDDDDEDGDNENDTETDNDRNQISETEEKPLDPRAGRVDVELPQIPFDAKAVADLVMTYRFHPTSTTKTRRQILRIAKEFNTLSEGKMPLGIKQVKLPEASKAETNSKGAALRLLKFEEELYSDTIRGKRKKKPSQRVKEDLDDEPESTPVKKKVKSIKTKHEDKRKTSVERQNLETSQSKCVTPKARIIKKTAPTLSSKKKVKIVLQRNTAQHTSEYMRQLRQSPAIPFDANRKPPVGVLKPSPIPSPVNPFYKKGFK